MRSRPSRAHIVNRVHKGMKKRPKERFSEMVEAEVAELEWMDSL